MLNREVIILLLSPLIGLMVGGCESSQSYWSMKQDNPLNCELTVDSVKEGLSQLTCRDGQLVYLYVSRKAMDNPKEARILASIHGYSGRLDDPEGRKAVRISAERWSKQADENGWVIIAPQFDERRFNNRYQQLNLRGIRADVHLNGLVEEIGRLLPGIPTGKILLIGFSGGGQFVHRYATFNPNRIERAVAGAAGWYTWPDAKLPYPVGIAPNSVPHGLRPRMDELCGLDLLVVVGADDINQSAFREQFENYDLMIIQGKGRRERAENWVAALREFAQSRGLPFRVKLSVIPNTQHNISSELRRTVMDFLSK